MKYKDSDGENTTVPVFEVTANLTEAEAQQMVEDRTLDAYVLIPSNFSAAVHAESMRYVQSAVSAGIQDQFAGLDPQSDDYLNQLMALMGQNGSGGGGGSQWDIS